MEPLIRDALVKNSWPRFLYPCPLGDNYFLVSCKPDKDALWGIYLVDTFDNMTMLYEAPGQAILEATIVQQRPRPPLRPSLIEPTQPARVKIIDIYQGPGLAGIPCGTVKSIRVISYAFSYRGMGGQIDRVGLDGLWRKAALDVDDGFRVCAPIGQFKANGWGLYDTAGNVWEWSSDQSSDGRAIACGGSWHTRPSNAGFDAQTFYPDWQKVFDVGFRVVISD